jgi:hypothetical protein
MTDPITKKDIEQAFEMLKANNLTAINEQIARALVLQDLFYQYGPATYYREILPMLLRLEYGR